jgi:hypothetical protein
MRGWERAIGVLVTSLAVAATAAAQGDDEALARQDRIEELERKVEVLTDEIAKLRTEQAVPEERGLESYMGMGPAASKIYGVARGLSLGGYAEGFYRHYAKDDSTDDVDRADALRAVLYVGYKFTDSLVFNSEIEFEHGTTGRNLDGETGSVSVEFAALDWMFRDYANLRTGLVLVPMGFVNEVHEPPFFHGVMRPEVEQRIIPSTWRENGVGLYGRLGEQLEYRTYVVTGLDARGVSPSNLRGARSSGNRSRAEDLAGVLRVDWTPPWIEGGLVGASVYHGGIDQQRDGYPGSDLTMWEAHAEFRRWGLELRGLVTQAFVSDAGDLTLALRDDDGRPGGALGDTQAIAKRWLGWYLEAAYDVMPWLAPDSGFYLAPFLRYERFDTQQGMPSGFAQDGTKDIRLITPGISFKPHPNVIFKVDYRDFDADQGEIADEVQLGFGVAF